MNSPLLIIALFLATNSLAAVAREHSLPVVDGRINYSEVVAVEGASKDELYARAKLWIASTLAPSTPLLLDDRENGILLSRGVLQVSENEIAVRTLANTRPTTVKTWEFTVKIQLREGRYKAELYDIDYTFSMPGNDVGHSPVTRKLDVLFRDPNMYRRDGTLKDGAPWNIATWTNDNLNQLLGSLRSALTEGVTLDDF